MMQRWQSLGVIEAKGGTVELKRAAPYTAKQLDAVPLLDSPPELEANVILRLEIDLAHQVTLDVDRAEELRDALTKYIDSTRKGQDAYAAWLKDWTPRAEKAKADEAARVEAERIAAEDAAKASQPSE